MRQRQQPRWCREILAATARAMNCTRHRGRTNRRQSHEAASWNPPEFYRCDADAIPIAGMLPAASRREATRAWGSAHSLLRRDARAAQDLAVALGGIPFVPVELGGRRRRRDRA